MVSPDELLPAYLASPAYLLIESITDIRPVRLAGGIISIIRSSNPNDIGLIIADFVLLNVGLIPLLVSLIGIIRIMYDFPSILTTACVSGH